MNLLDYVLIAIVGVSVVTAAMRGFVYEVWMMAAALAAIVLAAWKYPAAAGWFGWIAAPEARDFAGFVVVLAVVLVAAMIVGRMLRGAVRAVGLGWFDRLLGAGLGLIRGIVLGVAVVAMMTACPFHPGWVRRSELAPGFLRGSRILVAVLPADLGARFHSGLMAMGKELP